MLNLHIYDAYKLVMNRLMISNTSTFAEKNQLKHVGL